MEIPVFFAAMYSPVQLAARYLRYWITASNGKGHGIHSPFVYDFVTEVLNNKGSFYSFAAIEKLRKQMRQDDTLLEIEDMGAGSRINNRQERKVSSLAATALKPKKYGQLLFRIVDHYQPATILELGTSLGITTAYLASANQAATVTTIEGAPAIAKNASANFSQLKLGNIQLVTGNFDDRLQPVLDQLKKIDFAFIDGNHREEPTVRYFRQLLPYCSDFSIMVFDDIHWSAEMEAAWETIKEDESVQLTIDLFFIGLVVFSPGFKVKQHFTIRY